MLDSLGESRKRKRDTDDEGGNTTDKLTSDGGELEEDHHEEPEDEDLEDDFSPKTKTAKAKKQFAIPGASKGKGKTSTAKKPRTAKPKGATGVRKAKGDATIDVVKQIKDSHISDDNALFSALYLHPSYRALSHMYQIRF